MESRKDGQLREVAENLWEVSQPLPVAGINFGHRMTVARLASGELVVHSPVAWNAELEAELRVLGDPRYFVAPSRFHDLFWASWSEKMRGSRFYGVPGMRRRFSFMETLAEGGKDPWGSELERVSLAGMPWANENVFLHSPSRTLIVADMLFNLGEPGPALSRIMMRVFGISAHAGTSRFYRFAIRDRPAFWESLRQVMDLEFDRIIVGHGENVSRHGREVLREAYRWLRA